MEQYMVRNHVQHTIVKHIEIDFHFTFVQLHQKQFDIDCILFTKPVRKYYVLVSKSQANVSVQSPSAQGRVLGVHSI